GDLAEQRGSLALEERVLLHADDDVQVAGGAARAARLALAADAELAAGVHAPGDLDLQLPLHGEVSLSRAVLAARGHHLTVAVAAAAGPGHAEEPLLEGDLAAPPAGRAGGGGGAGRGAGALARRANLCARDLDRGLRPEQGLLERQLQVVAEV